MVTVGQVWQDNDKRHHNRFLRVVEVHADDSRPYAMCERVYRILYEPPIEWTSYFMKQTRISLDRFKPTATGYRLVADASEDVR